MFAVAVAVAIGDVERAGKFLGAADELRERNGLLGPAMLPYFERVLAQVEASPAAKQFQPPARKVRARTPAV